MPVQVVSFHPLPMFSLRRLADAHIGPPRNKLAGGFNVTLPVTRTDVGKAAAIKAARARGIGVRRTRDLGVGVGTVLRAIGEGAVPSLT
jgi:hypothetical protein